MIFYKKSLGQNFLTDSNVIKKILSLVEIKDKNIIEIGPGKGALSFQILKNNPKSLTLIEKDFNLSKNLEKKFFTEKKIKVCNEDILKYNLENKCMENTIVFGNLPYNISSQILVKFLSFNKWPTKISDYVFMFQKELGDKIIGNFKSSNYGRLSILTNFRFDVSNKFLVSPNCFFPKPKVTSMVLHFKPKLDEKYKIKNIKNLEKITNVLFSNKRKMINKNILKIFDQKKLKKLNYLDLTLRPAEIKPDIYYKITELFERK